MSPAESNAIPVGCVNPVLLICEEALLLDTKSVWPNTRSAEGPFVPAVNTEAGNRSTRLFPASVTQRLPDASKARPVRRERDNVLALMPPVLAPFVEKVVCPMIMLGNWKP